MDRSQYNLCVEQYADRLFRFAFSSLRNREEAEDVVQESFARVWEKLKTVDFAKAKSYLFTTAHHAMIDEVRQRQHFVSTDDSVPRRGCSAVNSAEPPTAAPAHTTAPRSSARVCPPNIWIICVPSFPLFS